MSPQHHIYLDPLKIDMTYGHVLAVNVGTTSVPAAKAEDPENDPTKAELLLVVCIHAEGGKLQAAVTLSDLILGGIVDGKKARDELRSGVPLSQLATRAIADAKPAEGGS